METSNGNRSVSGGFAFPSDSSDDSIEYDETEMAGPEALLFKHGFWPIAPFEGAQHHGATRETCPACSGFGWLWVLPTPPSPPRSSAKS